MAAQDKRNNGRLIGRVKNAFTSKAHEDHVDISSHKPRKPRRRPSLRVSFLEMRRSSLMGAPPKINELETPSNETMPDQHAHKEKRKSRIETDETSRVSFLDKNRSSFINEILGTAPTQDAAYHLGDVGRDVDMVITKGFEESLVAIAQLKEMDHAFVQRSNGQWRYSIVVATSKASTGEDPFIKFLVDDKGHTKEIPLRQWTKLIRLPAKQTNDDDHLDSHADLMLSSMAVGGSDESFARIRKYKSDPEVLHKADRAKPMEDSRRMSESCIPKPGKRLPSRRRQKVCPTGHVSASFTSSRIPSDFNLGVRRDSGATVSTSRTCTTSVSSRHRYSDMDAMKGSWRLSGVEKEHLTPNAFDLKSVKFNQTAFLAALNSISETSQPL